MTNDTILSLCEQHMRDKSGRFVPARLQAALALLERLRDHQSLRLDDHKSATGSSGLASHETYGAAAHARLGLDPLNKTHGRRSSHLQGWASPLLSSLRDAGFADCPADEQAKLLDGYQAVIGGLLREIAEQEPLVVSWRGRTLDAVVEDLLNQAASKNRLGEVAQYIVGAKLRLRFPELADQVDVFSANKGDRKGFADLKPRLGDFEINDVVIEVAAGPPDEKHLQQIVDILDNSGLEVLLLTRSRHLSFWLSRVQDVVELEARRVSVRSIETFVGQNLAELGQFSEKSKKTQLMLLAEVYNSVWVARLGTDGIRLVIK